MLHFNELRITPDSKYLIVDVSVDNADYFDKVSIDSIIIDTLDTFVVNGPSSTPIYSFTVETDYDMVYSIPERCCNPILDDDKSYCFIDLKQLTKNVRLYIPSKDIVDLNTNMFFVYAIATGYPTPDTPCNLDNSITMGTVVNLYPFYQSSIASLKELNDTCSAPKNFIDLILRFKALELSIKTGNYTLAIKYWKKFFSDPKITVTTNCGCHGRVN